MANRLLRIAYAGRRASAVQPADAGGLHHAGDINYTGTTFPAPYNTNNKTFFDSYYSGMIDLTTSGSYTFVNNGTDDTMAIYVDGQQVLAGTTTASQAWTVHNTQTVSLAAGMHSIAVVYFQGFGGYSLGAHIAGPNISGTADIGSAGAPQVTPDLVVGSLSGSGNVVLSTGNLSTGFDNTSATYSGAISGIGGVNKWGTGTQTLAGSNSYTGITSVMGGVLSFANSSALGLGNYNLSGGSMQTPAGVGSLSGNFAIAGSSGFLNGSPLTVTGSASFYGANLAAASPLTISGNVNLGPYANLFTTTGNTLTLSGSVSNSSVVTDAIVVNGSGNLVLSGSLNVTGLINNSGNTPALMMGGAGNGGGNANAQRRQSPAAAP